MSHTLLALVLACFSTSVVTLVESAASMSIPEVHFNLTEESPVGTRVGSLADHLAGAKAGMSFAIDMGPSSERASRYLAVDSRTGALTVTNRVDRETLCAHELRAASCALSFLAALTPSGTSMPDQFLRVSVNIIDRNDEPPAFYYMNGTRAERASAELEENSPPGTTITFPLVLRDPDLVGGALDVLFDEPSGTFELARPPAVGEPVALRVRSNATLDREKRDTYRGTVRVCDVAMEAATTTTRAHCAEAELVVLVSDVNEHAPELVHPLENLTLLESTALGPIASIRLDARDPDLLVNALVCYSFAPASRASDDSTASALSHFTIDPTNGVVSLVQPLDAASQRSFVLPIRLANADARPPLHRDYVLYITVRDTNDHSPLVTSVLPYAPARVGLGARGALEVPENTGPGAALAVLIARDGDLDKNAEFDCALDKGISNHPFELMPIPSPEPREKRYRLLNNAPIDFERTRSVSAAVRCTDRGEPPRSSLNVTTFHVLNVNEHPPVFPLCSASTAALSPPPPPADPTTQLEEILSGVEVLCCSSAPELEAGAECVLDVDFMEGEGSQGYRPQGSSDALGKRVRVRATDADADSELRYWLAPDNPRAALYLSLNSETGELRLREPLDRETLTQFDVKVFATDCPLTLRGPHPNPNAAAPQASGELCNHSVSALLRVRVADANDNVPQVLEPTTFEIAENAPPHKCFEQRVLTRDDDQSGSPNADVALSFAPSASAPAAYSSATSDPSRMFTLSSDGELCASQSLDRERQRTYYLTVYAADRGTPAQTATATLTVHVTDVNDNTPQWKTPDIVGRQSSSASGPSGHQVVQPPQGSNEKAGGEGDRKGTSSSPSYSSVFGVNVATDTPLGTTLLHLDAIDLDDGKNAQLRYLFKDAPPDFVSLNETTGRIVLTRLLESRDKKRHEVEVEVRDGGEPERRNTFTLALQLVGERFLVPSSGASDGGILSRLVGQGPLADWLASERFNFVLTVTLVAITAVLSLLLITAILCLRRRRHSPSSSSHGRRSRHSDRHSRTRDRDSKDGARVVAASTLEKRRAGAGGGPGKTGDPDYTALNGVGVAAVNASNGMNGGNGIGCEVRPYEEVYVAAAPGTRLSNATPVSYYCVTTGDPSDTLVRHSYYLPALPHSTCGHQMPSGAMGTLSSNNTMTMKRAGGAQGPAGQNQNPLSTFVSYRSGSIDGESLVNVDTNALDDAPAESLAQQPNGVTLGRSVQQTGPQSAGSGGSGIAGSSSLSANVRLSGSLGAGACSGPGAAALLAAAAAGASPGADNDSGRGRSTCDADRQTLFSGSAIAPYPGSDVNMNHLSALSLRPPSVPEDSTRSGTQQQAAALSSSSDSSDNPTDSNPVSSTSLGISSSVMAQAGQPVFISSTRGLTPANLSGMGYPSMATGISPPAPAVGQMFAVPMPGFAHIVHPSCPLHGHMTSPRKVDHCTAQCSAGLRLAPIPLSAPAPSYATLQTFGQSSPINTYGSSYGTAYGTAAGVEALGTGTLPTYGVTASGLAAAAHAHQYIDPTATSVDLTRANAATSPLTLGRRSPARLATLSTTLANTGVGTSTAVTGIESLVRFGLSSATNDGPAANSGRPVSPLPASVTIAAQVPTATSAVAASVPITKSKLN